MINVDGAWRQTLYNDQRDYLEQIEITLQEFEKTSDESLVQYKTYYTRSGSAGSYTYTAVANPSASSLSNYYQKIVLNLTNADIWSGSLTIDDAVSSESELQIGAAIINKLSFSINNMYGNYSVYDFGNARVSLKIGLNVGSRVEWIQKGKYVVNKATYNGEIIQIECYDYMYFFDVPYTTANIIYPAQMEQIVIAMCTNLGVTLATYDYPNKTYNIDAPPSNENTTCREVLSWIAQMSGCFARFNPNGQLEIKWYPQTALETVMDGLDGGEFDSATPYATGDSVDGGNFNPWILGEEYNGGAFQWVSGIHYISSLYSHSISVDDIVITGVRITYKVEDSSQSGEGTASILEGSEGYVIEISGNDFLNAENAYQFCSWLRYQLVGFRFRKANISHGSDPSIEAGDCAIIFDRKQNLYPIVVSVTRFSVGSSQTTVSAAKDPLRNSATRYSIETKNYVEMRKRLKNEATSRASAEAQLRTDIANSAGLYLTTEPDGSSGTKYYLHNLPLKSQSDIQILFSTAGITVTANGTAQTPTWYGLSANGNMLANILNAIGINASWIRAGRVVAANGSFIIDLDNSLISCVNFNVNSEHTKISNVSISIIDSYNSAYYTTMILRSDSLRFTVPYYTDGTIVGSGSAYIAASGGDSAYMEVVADDLRLEGNDGVAIVSMSSEQNPVRIRGDTLFYDDVTIWQGLVVVDHSYKSKEVFTDDYDKRLLYCYETASPYYGDIGEGQLDEVGCAYVAIDPIFSETIQLQTYQVFLQKYGDGDCYIAERNPSYFIVRGTPNLKFGWEIKGMQGDLDYMRLDEREFKYSSVNNRINYTQEAEDHLTQIRNERINV